jgi:hypothetical protein
MNKWFMLMMLTLSFAGLSAQEADVEAETVQNEQSTTDVTDNKDVEVGTCVEVSN